MIKITIDKNSIEAEGHASKLVCNSVSVLMWALATSLDNSDAKDLNVIESDGYQLVEFTPTEQTKPIFDGLFDLLERWRMNTETK